MAKIPMAKVPMPKMGKAPAMPSGGGAKPHIRMRKMKPVPPSAFPTAPMAFPQSPIPGGADMGGPPTGPSPDQGMTAQPGGMSAGAGPGDMGA